MDNSSYVTLSRQIALFREMDITAGNLANVNTTGFDGEHVLFSSYLTHDVNNGQKNDMSFAYDVSSYRNTSQGSIRATNNPLDVALQGRGYFAVETPLGTRYTRDGNFTMNQDGVLVTADGYPVLDTAGQHIEFPDNTTSVDVGTQGNLKVNGEDFATIGVVQFANENVLQRAGNNLYSSDVSPAAADETVQVIQGSLENSNVEPIAEMTHMISVSRAVSETSQFVNAIYDLESKTADAWAQQSS